MCTNNIYRERETENQYNIYIYIYIYVLFGGGWPLRRVGLQHGRCDAALRWPDQLMYSYTVSTCIKL